MKTPGNLLITGGCGFIGANFVNFAFEYWPQCKIVNLDKLILNSDVNYVNEKVRNSDRYQLVLGDIRNSAVVSDILTTNNVSFPQMTGNCSSG
jgi:dTDP-D-glucose 4,6-dehydratase